MNNGMGINLDHIFNEIDLAIAVFNNNGELLFFNDNLIDLWHMPRDFLHQKPYIVEFFQLLREGNIYPLDDDFKKFCNQMVSYLSKSHINLKQNIVLYNGKSFEQRVIKNNDFLLLLWEDKTNIWDITFSLNNQKNIYSKIIDKNPHAVIVVSSSGYVENYNGKFLELFNISNIHMENKPHIRDIISSMWLDNQEKPILLGNMLSNRNFQFNTKISDESILYVNGIFLPNTDMFVIFYTNGITKNTPIEETQLIDNITLLQNKLVYDLNYLIGDPLNTIIGFSEMLKNEYVGGLNIKQMEYVDKILSKAQAINQELTYKLELLEFNSHLEIEIEDVDINILIAYILQNLKPRLSNKGINITINFSKNIVDIKSSMVLLVKSITLLLLYLIEQNVNKSQISIDIVQKNNITTFSIKDNSKDPILSDYDLKNRYDIILTMAIFERLNVKLDYSYKNKSQRNINIIIENN